MTTVDFRVVGVPHPQGSKSAFRNPHTGRIAMVEGKGTGTEKHKAWRNAVAEAASRHVMAEPGFEPLDGPLGLRVWFWLPRPASKPRWKWMDDRRPDLGKLVRATEDSMSGVVYTDDARIVAIAARKMYALGRPPGARIIVVTLAELEDTEGRRWLAEGGPAPLL